MIACVLNIGLIRSGLVIKAVQAVEYFMKAGLQSLFNFRLSEASLSKDISIV